ncbi:DUF4352 domain-containing protein [Streptomyces sp. NPDC017979]|uniref:DUF4352 domain-containing protein n=1 Tax=Streptomyces sp. NPDC017979 TaxID=3365024 RepID=UPI0037B7B7F0
MSHSSQPPYGNSPQYGDGNPPQQYGTGGDAQHGAAPYGDQQAAAVTSQPHWEPGAGGTPPGAGGHGGHGGPAGPAGPGGGHRVPLRNGLGTAALILGIIGLITGPIPFVFWLGGTLGLLALILGLVGRGRAKRGEASNRRSATAGSIIGGVAMALGVVGAILTVQITNDAVDELDKSLDEATAVQEPGLDDKDGKGGKDKGKKGKGKKGKGGGDGDGSGAGGAYAPGDTASYDDGLKVTVTAAKKFTPGEYAAGHASGNKAYKVTVSLENTGTKNFDTVLTIVDARAGADGVTAEKIYDDAVGMGFDGNVAPGKKATVTFGFSSPAEAKNLTVEVTPGFDYGPVQWELPV